MVKFLDNVNLNRITYSHTQDKLTVAENTDRSICLANGEYITVIGDDDFVNPNILKIVNKVKESAIKVLNYTPANYYWPSVEFNKHVRFNFPSSLQIPTNSSITRLKKFDSHTELQKVFDCGCVSMLDLPKVYHGLVHRDVLIDVKNKFGQIVCGSSPDMALAVAVSTTIDEYFHMNYPLTITGVSKSSAAGMGAALKHNNTLDKVPWLRDDILDVWNPKLPKFWQGYTIWCQSVYEVLSVIGDDHKKINYKALYSKSYIMRDHIDKENIAFMLEDGKLSSYFLFFKSFVLKMFRKLLDVSPVWMTNLYFKFRGDFNRFNNIRNITDIEMCMSYLKNNQL
jgi:hypothetical protein